MIGMLCAYTNLYRTEQLQVQRISGQDEERFYPWAVKIQNTLWIWNKNVKAQNNIKISTLNPPSFSEAIPEDQSEQQFSRNHVDDLLHLSETKDNKG